MLCYRPRNPVFFPGMLTFAHPGYVGLLFLITLPRGDCSPSEFHSWLWCFQKMRLAFGKCVFCLDCSVGPSESGDSCKSNCSYRLMDGRLTSPALLIQHLSLAKVRRLFHPKSPQNQIFTWKTYVLISRVNKDREKGPRLKGLRLRLHMVCS